MFQRTLPARQWWRVEGAEGSWSCPPLLQRAVLNTCSLLLLLASGSSHDGWVLRAKERSYRGHHSGLSEQIWWSPYVIWHLGFFSFLFLHRMPFLTPPSTFIRAFRKLGMRASPVAGEQTGAQGWNHQPSDQWTTALPPECPGLA